MELQRLAASRDTPLTELLRRAKMVAVKLNIEEARSWIDHETDGYPEGGVLPPYRVIPCELRAFHPRLGWQPVRWEESSIVQKYFAHTLFRDPIANVQEFATAGNVQQANLSQGDIDILSQLGNQELTQFRMARFYSRANFVGVLEGVRTKILDWSLVLEKKGVLGRSMTFDETEKERAAGMLFRADGVSVVVLFLSANPDRSSPLDVETEQNRIVKVRNGSRHQGKVRIECLPDLDLPEFAKSLRLHSPAVVHFSGHGEDDGSLVMRDENGATHEMRPKGLAKLLALQKSRLRLVVLNACYSSAMAELLIKDIDCVIGMVDEVSDNAAILL